MNTAFNSFSRLFRPTTARHGSGEGNVLFQDNCCCVGRLFNGLISEYELDDGVTGGCGLVELRTRERGEWFARNLYQRRRLKWLAVRMMKLAQLQRLEQTSKIL